jgi:hypothetical protein
MRGSDIMQESLFMVGKLEDFVPEDHPPRPIRLLVNEALGRMNSLFDTIYADSVMNDSSMCGINVAASTGSP